MSTINNCKKCGKEIIFRKTASGKSVPCDPNEVPAKYDIHGKAWAYCSEDGVMRTVSTCSESDETGYHYVHLSHFATCTYKD